MAGILDSKERVLDYIITQEGKRQAGQGELKVKFASFTDYHTFYETSGSLFLPELAADATDRIFFEAYSRIQDVILPELEAGQSMRPFRAGDFSVAGNLIASGTFKKGFSDYPNVPLLIVSSTVNGEEIERFNGTDTSVVQPLLNSITQNFNQQRIIGSVDDFSLTNNFSLAKPQTNFFINDKTQYFRSKDQGLINVSDVPSIFQDGRFSKFQNFKFLPPRNLPMLGEVTGSVLAEYSNLNETEAPTTLPSLMNFLADKQKLSVNFSETSNTNNLVCQIFESSAKNFNKLSVVDFGVFEDENPNSLESLESPGRRVFFIGKILTDAQGAETFLRIFTIVID